MFLFSSSLYFANAEFFRASVEKALQGAAHPPTLFVLDTAAMDDIDYTGGRALIEVVDNLQKNHITVAVARAVGATEVDLERSGCLEKIGRDHFFSSVDAAVRALGPPGVDRQGTEFLAQRARLDPLPTRPR